MCRVLEPNADITKVKLELQEVDVPAVEPGFVLVKMVRTLSNLIPHRTPSVLAVPRVAVYPIRAEPLCWQRLLPPGALQYPARLPEEANAASETAVPQHS